MEVDEEPDGSGCAGAAVVTAVSLALLWGLYRVFPAASVLALWVLGWSAIVWAARKPLPGTAIPAPPPPSEGAPEEEPQVTAVRDTSHPNRWLITRPSRWVAEPIEKDRDKT